MARKVLGPPSVTCQIPIESISEFQQASNIQNHLKLSTRNSNYTPGLLNWDAFVNRLSKFNNRLAIVIFEVKHCDGFQIVEFADGSVIPLLDIFTGSIGVSQASFLVYIKSDNALQIAPVDVPSNVLFLRCGGEEVVLEAALASYFLTYAWFSETAYKTDFTAVQLVEALTNLGKNIGKTLKIEEARVLTQASDILIWPDNERNYLPGVDIDRYREGFRHEQKLDTLKRLLDEEATSIGLHSNIESRKAAAQALLWLLLLKIDASEWWPLSRIASLVNPDATAPFVNRRAVPNGKQICEDALQGLMDRFLTVPTGEYHIGFDHATDESEPPAFPHKRMVKRFLILDSPVTVGDWLVFAQSPACKSIEQLDPMLPITEVNAAEAMDFAKIVTEVIADRELIPKNMIARLPSEFEWEAAARSGPNAHYPWGELYDPQNCNADQLIGQITRVDRFDPKGLSHVGCRDMSGNVREWTSSKVGPKSEWADYRTSADTVSSTTVRPNDRLVIRGGSYSFDPKSIRTWVRNTQIAGRDDIHTGFRLILAERNGC